jgi:hypothetical protein
MTYSDGTLFRGNRSLRPHELIHTREITLSSAELLALDTTPIEVIPAPGSGRAIVVWDYYGFLDFNSVAYTDGDLKLHYTDAAGQPIIQFNSDWHNAAADSHTYGLCEGPTSLTFGLILTPAAPVVICDTGVLATGNSIIKLRLRYEIIDLAT